MTTPPTQLDDLTKLGRHFAGFGEPGAYDILDRPGKITCQNGVPISTMDALLANAHAASV